MKGEGAGWDICTLVGLLAQSVEQWVSREGEGAGWDICTLVGLLAQSVEQWVSREGRGGRVGHMHTGWALSSVSRAMGVP